MNPGTARRPLIHPLASCLPGGLIRTLRDHGGVGGAYWPQALLIFFGAVVHWPFCFVESIRADRRALAFSFDPPPIFIIGHWRSGTTFLHNLLSCDPQFCFPTNADVFRPFDFYPGPLEFISRGLLARSMPGARPDDGMSLAPDLPQEDEIALATMAAPSFFNCYYFPRKMEEVFAREVLFQDLPAADVDRFSHNLRLFLGKVAARYPGRRLLAKNPAHSTRIPLLQRMFPGAKFIHIHRDPVDVLASTASLMKKWLLLLSLQDHDPDDVDRLLRWGYPAFMESLFSGLAALPRGDVAEIRYADLAKSPASVLEAVYAQLGLPGFASAKSAIAAHARDEEQTRSGIARARKSISAEDAALLAPYRRRLGYDDLRGMQA